MRVEKLTPFGGALIGAFIGSCISFDVNRMLSIAVGIVVGTILGVIIVLLLKRNNLPANTPQLPEEISIPKLYKSYIAEIKSELRLRQYAARRLHTCEFWIQILNIYYSCFTAAIAIWGVSGKTNFLSIPSALLTVLVAILVTYANAQNCGNRARDLEANCRDIANTLTKFSLIIDKQNGTEINTIMEDFYKKLGDSESPSNVDSWKFEKSELYFFYIILVSIIIVILFVAPFLIIIYRKELTTLFCQ